MKVIKDKEGKITWPCLNCYELNPSEGTCEKDTCSSPKAYAASLSVDRHTTDEEKSIKLFRNKDEFVIVDTKDERLYGRLKVETGELISKVETFARIHLNDGSVLECELPGTVIKI